MLSVTILLAAAGAALQAQDPAKTMDESSNVQAITSKYSNPTSYDFEVEAKVNQQLLEKSTAMTRPPADQGENVAYAKEEEKTEISAEGTFQSGKPGKIEANGVTAFRSGGKIASKVEGERWVVGEATPFCPKVEGETASLENQEDAETLAVLASIPLPHEVVQAVSGKQVNTTANEDPGLLTDENTVYEFQLSAADFKNAGVSMGSHEKPGQHGAAGKESATRAGSMADANGRVCVRLVCDSGDKSLESIEVFVFQSGNPTMAAAEDERRDQLMKLADACYTYKISDLNEADEVDVPEDLPALAAR